MTVDDLLAKIPLKRFQNPPPVVSVLPLSGIIGRAGPLVRGGLTITGVAGQIEAAFKVKRLKAVALVINSPGGSPVQSSLIAKRIRALADENEVPVIAFVEDVAASGGYWLACAADEIIVDPSSIVGSIGVVSSGFGLHRFIESHGVERRVHTAGERKRMLDMFRPEDPEDVAKLEAMLADLHETFKDQVRTSRGARIKAPEDEVFNGEFWTGREALGLGLVDAIGDIRAVMRERYGEDVRFRRMAPRESWIKRKLGLGPIGEPAAWADALVGAVEERAMWQRYGL